MLWRLGAENFMSFFTDTLDRVFGPSLLAYCCKKFRVQEKSMHFFFNFYLNWFGLFAQVIIPKLSKLDFVLVYEKKNIVQVRIVGHHY